MKVCISVQVEMSPGVVQILTPSPAPGAMPVQLWPEKQIPPVPFFTCAPLLGAMLQLLVPQS